MIEKRDYIIVIVDIIDIGVAGSNSIYYAMEIRTIIAFFRGERNVLS